MADETIQANTGESERGRIVRIIGRLTATLVGVLALAAFGLSFEALRDLAVVSGGMNRGVAWLFPLILDGGIAVFSLAALRASITGADRTWFMWLVVTVTVVSVGLNIAHANKGIVPAVIGAMPPVLLFLAFESLMRQVHDTVTPRPSRKASRTSARKPAGTVIPIQGIAEDRRAKALALFAQGASRNRIARELGMAHSTVRRYLANSDAA